MDDCEHSFQVLKKCLCKAPIFALPMTTGSWILQMNASKKTIGAVLLQLQNNSLSGKPVEKVITYYSWKLKDPETQYPTYDWELLAIRDAASAKRHVSVMCYPTHQAV